MWCACVLGNNCNASLRVYVEVNYPDFFSFFLTDLLLIPRRFKCQAKLSTNMLLTFWARARTKIKFLLSVIGYVVRRENSTVDILQE